MNSHEGKIVGILSVKKSPHVKVNIQQYIYMWNDPYIKVLKTTFALEERDSWYFKWVRA
jgi:hypothetical protein